MFLQLMVASLFVCGITEGRVPNRAEAGKRAGAFTQFHFSVVNDCDGKMNHSCHTKEMWVLTIKNSLEFVFTGFSKLQALRVHWRGG